MKIILSGLLLLTLPIDSSQDEGCSNKPRLPHCDHPITCSLEDECDDPEFFPIYDPVTRRVSNSSTEADFCMIYRDPCYTGSPLPLHKNFELFSDGTLYLPETNSSYSYMDFCIWKIEDQWEMFVCNEDSAETMELLKAVGMLLSVFFLTVTFAIYLLIEELLNIHGRTLCAYIGCLIVGYGAAGSKTILYKIILFSDWHCYLLGTLFCSVYVYSTLFLP